MESKQEINRIMVISHTHWDPEWYSSFEEYRMRLVELMNKLFYILENIPEYHSFMFDGQISPLEAYLELFHENEERIKSLVQKGKLLIGPWFIMPDEYMVGPEAHIHNLLLGIKISRKYGNEMKVGYLPDMAGHISQMPQILKGFGIDSAVVWRGVAGYPETYKTEFIWKAPDGSEVLAIHLPWAYGTHLFLFDNTEDTFEKILKLKERQETRNSTNIMLLMNGGDHEEPHPLLPQIVKEINAREPGFKLEHTNILEYINAVRKELKNPDIHIGEMRRTETSFLMNGIQSTRVPIKQENNKTEILLERWVEPLCTNDWLTGSQYPQRLIWAAWKYDLQNNFHDDIYGAHVDEVTVDVMNRYKRAQEIGERLVAIASYNIANKIDTSDWYRALVVFNPNSWDRTGIVEADIDFPLEDNIEAFRITYNEKDAPFQILGRYDFVKYQSERNIMDGQKPTGPVRRYKILLLVENLPALGYRAYRIEPLKINEKLTFASLVKLNGRTIENDLLKVEIAEGGYFKLVDRLTGETYYNCNIIEDGGDVGDCYTYQVPLKDILVTNLGGPSRLSIIETGPLRVTVKVDLDFLLPISASPDEKERSVDKVICPLSLYISLDAVSPYVSIRTEFDNKAKDHRLRVKFLPDIPTKQVYVDGHFDILSRDIELPAHPDWIEKPSPTQPQRNFVALQNENRGLALLNRGLIQYEATNESKPALALTLLRCIGYLSKSGLDERNGHHCGPGLPTPSAQCLGPHVFEYAVYPYSPSKVSLSEIHRLGLEFNTSFRTVDIRGRKGDLPIELSFCRVKGGLVSCYKKAEDNDRLVVRIYNVNDRESEVEIEFFKSIKDITEVNLAEESLMVSSNISVSNNRLNLLLPPKKIVTFSVQL